MQKPSRSTPFTLYGILGKITLFPPPIFLVQLINPPKMQNKRVLTLLFPLRKEAQNRNLAKISGSKLLSEYYYKFYRVLYNCHSLQHIPSRHAEQSLWKQCHKKQFATTSKRNGLMKFCLSHLQNKFNCQWCHRIKGSSRIKKDFPVWKQAGC